MADYIAHCTARLEGLSLRSLASDPNSRVSVAREDDKYFHDVKKQPEITVPGRFACTARCAGAALGVGFAWMMILANEGYDFIM